ncbi:siderophore-interacting protein [Acerihabitans sp. KWT182]|uniref:Siderophore-interacting protein n=1 Tax=Acerihabitans sp. KWT182 TaxID=3157919 RepID=A0AAU7QEX6_9GAMM
MERNLTTGAKRPVRVKNELKFRTITVKRCQGVFGCYRRIVFTGEALSGFISPGFDDHIKVFFPSAPGAKIALPRVSEEGIDWGTGPRPVARDYTPLRYDAATNELTLDFYLHAKGVASDWAAGAKPGDTLVIGGPRGSLLIPMDYARQLYICDETGLPALARRCGELITHGAAQKAVMLVSVRDARCREYLKDYQEVSIEWIVADEQGDALLSRIKDLSFTGGDAFVWVTGEGRRVKNIADFFTEECGLEPDFVRAVAYWHDK